MDALKILAAVNTKVVGAHVDGLPLPLIGMRPAHTVLDYRGGTLNPKSPIEQGLAETGFRPLAAGARVPRPHRDWTIRLPTPASYQAAYQGETQFNSHMPVPQLWSRLVRQTGWCLLLLQREAGPEVRGQELLTDMFAGECLAVTARLV